MGFRDKVIKRVAYFWIALSILGGVIFAVERASQLSSNYVTDRYCQINGYRKTGDDVINETLNNPCQSTIVLDYDVDEFEPYLTGTLYIGAFCGAVLAIAGVAAIIGFCRACLPLPAWYPSNTRLVQLWLVASFLWNISLVVTMIILGKHYDRPHVLTLLWIFILSLISFICVGCYCWITTTAAAAADTTTDTDTAADTTTTTTTTTTTDGLNKLSKGGTVEITIEGEGDELLEDDEDAGRRTTLG